MIFSTPTYLVFFAVVLAVLAMGRSARFKRAFLLLASYFFYGWWDWRFVGLLIGLTALSYVGARWIHAQRGRPRAKHLLIGVVGLDVAVLGLFKYYGFFVGSADQFLRHVGFEIPLLQILLPVAISFVTFEVISYVVDIYRGELEPAPVIDLALLVAFFPHLIAGPILKPKKFLPQLRGDVRVTSENLNRGVQEFVLGLAMKVLIADRLATFVNPVFSHTVVYSSATLWLAVFAFAIQIYADFAGYSHMAIGSARCMGFDIPPNFDAPYASRSITEFWRRWHISLSTWLREYVYIPLGGNRKGPARQAINLMLVMLLAGLWHGASWNFVVWGGLHGAALVVHKVWVDRVTPRVGSPGPAGSVLAWLTTFGFVSLAWVFFRAPSLLEAATVLGRMFGVGDTSGVAWYSTGALLVVPAVLLVNLIYARRDGGLPVLRLGTFRGAFIAGIVVIGLVLFAPTIATPFIYFQF